MGKGWPGMLVCNSGCSATAVAESEALVSAVEPKLLRSIGLLLVRLKAECEGELPAGVEAASPGM